MIVGFESAPGQRWPDLVASDPLRCTGDAHRTYEFSANDKLRALTACTARAQPVRGHRRPRSEYLETLLGTCVYAYLVYSSIVSITMFFITTCMCVYIYIERER